MFGQPVWCKKPRTLCVVAVLTPNRCAGYWDYPYSATIWTLHVPTHHHPHTPTPPVNTNPLRQQLDGRY